MRWSFRIAGLVGLIFLLGVGAACDGDQVYLPDVSRGGETENPLASPTPDTLNLPIVIAPAGESPGTGTVSSPSGEWRVSVLYDNLAYEPDMATDWGFAALVEVDEGVVLFDTGRQGEVLLDNMAARGINPARVEAVVLSHAHEDHIGGLTDLLETGVHPVVYLLDSFPAPFKDQIGGMTTMIEASPGERIAPGVFTTGRVGDETPEQALIIQTPGGLIVLTGCAHPGVTQMVARAIELRGGSVRLVAGGFHLENASQAQIDEVLADFRRLQVARVAPSHCTGDRAMAAFRAEYGVDFLQSGVGRLFDNGE